MFIVVNVDGYKEPYRINVRNISYYFSSQGFTVFKLHTGEVLPTATPIKKVDEQIAAFGALETVTKIVTGIAAAEMDNESAPSPADMTEMAFNIARAIEDKLSVQVNF